MIMYNMMISIKKLKPSKIGNSYHFRIPAIYVSNHIINPNKEYDIQIKEVDQHERATINNTKQ